MQGGGEALLAEARSVSATPAITHLPVKRFGPELVKPAGPTEAAPQYLSNIDQVLAFSVETVYFYAANLEKCSSNVARTLREALGKVLVAYPFLAGRLKLCEADKRLEVDCNRAGAQFEEAETELSIADLGDVTVPNPAFHSLVPQAWGAARITDVPLIMVQVTRFSCGGFSVGFTMGHINYDGLGAIEFLTNYTSLCKGGGILVQPNHERTLLRARNPPTPMFDHPEYISAADIATLAAGNPFTTTDVASCQFEGLHASDKHVYKLFHFSADMLSALIKKASQGKEEHSLKVVGSHGEQPAKKVEANGNSNGAAAAAGKDSNGAPVVDNITPGSKTAAANGSTANGSVASNGLATQNGGHKHNAPVVKAEPNGTSDAAKKPQSVSSAAAGAGAVDRSPYASNGSSGGIITTNGNHSKKPTKVSTFEALASHIWQARSRSVDWPHPSAPATLMFAVDIRNRVVPPLPKGICCNAVFSACARASFQELADQPLSFCVERVQSAIARVDDQYVRSSLDWWEVHRGIPALPGGVFISAWWKLPFYEVDFGWGKPIFAGPIVSSMTEFVLMLPTGRPGGGLNVVIALKPHEMEKFEKFVQI